MIKFNKYHVQDTETGIKARIFYSLDNHVSGQNCIVLYAKDFGGSLGKIFADDYKNETDIMTDYFEKGHVCLFESHPLYEAARNRASTPR